MFFPVDVDDDDDDDDVLWFDVHLKMARGQLSLAHRPTDENQNKACDCEIRPTVTVCT